MVAGRFEERWRIRELDDPNTGSPLTARATVFVIGFRTAVVAFVSCLIVAVFQRHSRPSQRLRASSWRGLTAWLMAFAVMLQNYLVLYPLRLRMEKGLSWTRILRELNDENWIATRSLSIWEGWISVPIIALALLGIRIAFRRRAYDSNDSSQLAFDEFVRGGTLLATISFTVAVVSLLTISMNFEADFQQEFVNPGLCCCIVRGDE